MASYNACIRLLYEVEYYKYRDHPYCLPYMQYVMSWSAHLPINTIIIGQNPYPTNIYPEIGSALSYDINKSKRVPPSVNALADDVYLYDGTSRQDTIACFEDSWILLEKGIILINETVFHKIADPTNRTNTRSIREMEAQIRAIQIILSESYLLAQNTFTILGMGTPATMMLSILRSWCPKDLFNMKILSCPNPAAISRHRGDSTSLFVTLGKKSVSKLLSGIVSEYVKMSYNKSNVAQKRRQQNIDSLKQASEKLTESYISHATEVRNFKDRLRIASENPANTISIKDALDSCDSMVRTMDKYNSAIVAHQVMMSMVVDSVAKDADRKDSTINSNPAASIVPTIGTSGARRRRVTPAATPQPVPPIQETIEPDPVVPTSGSTVVESTTNVSRARRRRVVVGNSASVAGTEYTNDTSKTPVNSGNIGIMGRSESYHITSFATWFRDNVTDSSYAEILHTSAEEKDISNDITRDMISYITGRMNGDPGYDAFDELSDPDSRSTMFIKDWVSNNIK